jgi:tetratricopeptide (TPR) repeat protein
MREFAVIRLVSLGALAALLSVGAQPAVAQSTDRESPAAASAASQPAPKWMPLAVVGLHADEALDTRDAWMPTAVTETLAWRLRRVPGLTVIPTIRAHQSRQELIEKADDPPAEWSQVVRLMGAKRWLRGKCAGTPYAAVLDLELVQVDQPGAKPVQVRLGPGRLFDVVDEATRWALGELGVARIDQTIEELILAPPAQSPTALEYYAKALAAARREGFRDSYYYAQQAVDTDPGNCPALLLLARIELRSSAEIRQQAELHLRQAKLVAASRRDAITEAEFEVTQGLALLMQRSFESARQRFETALTLARERDDPYGQLAAMNSLCDYWLNYPPTVEKQQPEQADDSSSAQNLRRAVEWQIHVLDLLHELGDHIAEAPGANKLALIYERLNEPQLAFEAHQRTIAAARKIGSARTEATGWLFLGQWYRRQERWAEALEATTRCLALVPEEAKPMIRITLGEIYRGMSMPREALGQYESAYAALADGDDLLSQFRCLHATAELLMESGEREAAITKLAEALDIAHALELAETENIRKQLAQWKAQTP